jgi:hypothetical protein
MFWAALENLFGKNSKQFGYPEFYHEFCEFDDQFEIASSPIPHFMLKTFSHRRSTLTQKLSDFAKNQLVGGTVVDSMVKMFDKPEDAKYFLLSALWALETNSLSIVFWTIAHILTEPGLR